MTGILIILIDGFQTPVAFEQPSTREKPHPETSAKSQPSSQPLTRPEHTEDPRPKYTSWWNVIDCQRKGRPVTKHPDVPIRQLFSNAPCRLSKLSSTFSSFTHHPHTPDIQWPRRRAPLRSRLLRRHQQRHLPNYQRTPPSNLLVCVITHAMT